MRRRGQIFFRAKWKFRGLWVIHPATDKQVLRLSAVPEPSTLEVCGAWATRRGSFVGK